MSRVVIFTCDKCQKSQSEPMNKVCIGYSAGGNSKNTNLNDNDYCGSCVDELTQLFDDFIAKFPATKIKGI